MKIYIIGSVGSGKTTLARKIAEKKDITAYELDNVVWERHPDGDRRRASAERNAILQDIVKKDSWIIEGAQHADWVLPAMQSADQILFLDPPNRVRQYRIVKRFIRQKLHLEKANYRPSLHILRRMFAWNAQFQNQDRKQVFHSLRSFSKKIVLLRTKRDINRIVDLI
ncbi:DNA topology modulation protein FlaR [Sporolactobacillus sp. STCC-11]|uniref:DNA topology modulation protein FlaR n=1 Tax=Sporolactobacillus caesalpiniae TaxID=3230362 RepID=UPI003390AB35